MSASPSEIQANGSIANLWTNGSHTQKPPQEIQVGAASRDRGLQRRMRTVTAGRDRHQTI